MTDEDRADITYTLRQRADVIDVKAAEFDKYTKGNGYTEASVNWAVVTSADYRRRAQVIRQFAKEIIK